MSSERSASGGPRLALRGSRDGTGPGIHDRDRRSLSLVESQFDSFPSQRVTVS